MITTLHNGVLGEMDEAVLDRLHTIQHTAQYVAEAVEYRLKGTDTLVHRSAHVRLHSLPVGLEHATF